MLSFTNIMNKTKILERFLHSSYHKNRLDNLFGSYMTGQLTPKEWSLEWNGHDDQECGRLVVTVDKRVAIPIENPDDAEPIE